MRCTLSLTVFVLSVCVVLETTSAQRGTGRRGGTGPAGFQRGGLQGSRGPGGSQGNGAGAGGFRRPRFGAAQSSGGSEGGPGTFRGFAGGTQGRGPGAFSPGGRSGFGRGGAGSSTRPDFSEGFSRNRSGVSQSDATQRSWAFSGTRNADSPAKLWRAREKQRMTVDLPAAYAELDTDLDGQIGLYEWVEFRRDEIALFEEIDLDVDAMLTPHELTAHQELLKSADAVAAVFAEKYNRPRLTIVTGSGITTSGEQSDSGITDEHRQRTKESAQRVFTAIDRDHDGKISAEEINENPRIAPMFERAGGKITSMSQEEFTSLFAKTMQKMRGAAGDGGMRPGGDRSGFGGGRDFGGGMRSGGATRGGFGGGRGRGGS